VTAGRFERVREFGTELLSAGFGPACRRGVVRIPGVIAELAFGPLAEGFR
jgi:hypothetical protein